MVYQFKIQLQNVSNPTVWRRLQVPANYTFHELHLVIQMSFGWANYHLYQFSPTGYGSKPKIAMPDPEGWDMPDKHAGKVKLDKIFNAEKQKYTYIYDFGDDWIHKITLEKILPDEIKYPVCLAGKGECPPEDCGGPWGYENLKAILADPSHEEYEDMKEWLGFEDDDEWDAHYFDKEMINEILKDWAEHPFDPSLN